MPARSMLDARDLGQRHHLPTLRGQWAVLVVALAVIGGQWWISSELHLQPVWLWPVAATALLAASIVTVVLPNGNRMLERVLGVALISVLIFANALSIGAFILLALKAASTNSAAQQLLIDGVVLWLLNIGVFGIAYWEVDGPGPAHRRPTPKGHYNDFLFPQQQPDVEPDWLPAFSDYLYVALTNAIAFSPTDAMPLTRTAKSLMAIQSITSIAALLVLVARALNMFN